MKVELIKNNGIVTLVPKENITTANINVLMGRIDTLILNNTHNIAIDFENKIDVHCAQAIGMFLSMSEKTKEKGGGFFLLNVHGRLLSLFQFSNIRDKLNIFDSKEDLNRWIENISGAMKMVSSTELRGNILIVDDEKEQLESLRMLLEIEGYRTFIASNGLEAKVQVNRFPIDLILLDINMPEMNGIEFMKIVRKEKMDMKIIIVSGYPSFEYAAEALRQKASDFVTKPYNPYDLKAKIRECLLNQQPTTNNLQQLEVVSGKL
ncbi:MAG: response regulator [Nitrospinae bacterium]|nr:response regulator [Nitrospinota bacterium]